MEIKNIPIPEIYKSSSDFRFFVDLFECSLSQLNYDTENLSDCYDPLRCKSSILWMLAETLGYQLDDRLPIAFNRLVLLYFMSMIRNKGSKDGVTLAAEVNLAQFSILEYGKDNEILYDRLDDPSIPVNSVYVTPHTKEGYIDVVYVSTDVPIDSCLEYVRPLGMYLFQSAGVRVDGKSKISVDARLTDSNNLGMSIGSTHTGHYRREDYARIQKTFTDMNNPNQVNESHNRRNTYYRNSDVELKPNNRSDSGYRTLCSLQLCNNSHIVKSTLKDPIFSLGYGPSDVVSVQPEGYIKQRTSNEWNLRLDRTLESELSSDVYVSERSDGDKISPVVNPIMGKLGDAISMDTTNSKFTKVDSTGNISIVDVDK